MTTATEVRLVGEGGVEWTFELPLSEPFADQVKARTLRPADEKSAALLADLLSTDGADGASDNAPPSELTLAERIAAVSSHAAANELGRELGVEGFTDKKPPVAEKKQALLDAAAAASA